MWMALWLIVFNFDKAEALWELVKSRDVLVPNSYSVPGRGPGNVVEPAPVPLPVKIVLPVLQHWKSYNGKGVRTCPKIVPVGILS